MADDRNIPSRNTLSDSLGTVSDADRADQSLAVDGTDEADRPPESVSDRFIDEADALDQGREEPLDDPDEHETE